MSVSLRLTRQGTRNRPHYRVIATDIRAPRDGRFIEILGWYDPLQNPSKVELDLEKVDKWLGHGAKPSKTVERLIRSVRAQTPQD